MGALTGYTVGVTAERRRAELGAALERHGARVMYAPAIHIVPLADDARLLAATEQVLAAPVDYVVATTAVGFRGWLATAAEWGLGEQLTGALRRSRIVARGPKVQGAVRAADLRESWSPPSESIAEVLTHLTATGELAARRVAVQLHGEPLTDFVDALRAAGADVIEVPVYRWAPPEDVEPLHRLIEASAASEIDCVTFTSAPAATNFLRTAVELGRAPDLHAALQHAVLCAAVGPVTAAPLLAAGIPVVQPERFRLGALVREVVRQLPARR